MNINLSRVEALNKNNYDTWRMQAEALLVKNDYWQYVSGEKVKPEIIEGDAASVMAYNKWITDDKKAKSDLILSISPTELKQLKGCETARETWLKLESIYASKGPARKATLLKQLTLQKMQECDDVREHINKFFDAVDKLEEMNVEINPDLLSIMLLYSLPGSYENFRCAIESRDNLPGAEALKIKILEESDARKQSCHTSGSSNAMWATAKKDQYGAQKFQRRKDFEENKSRNDCKGMSSGTKSKYDITCYRCNKKGHIAAKCYSKITSKENNRGNKGNAKLVEETYYAAVANTKIERQLEERWCLDSGCTAHLCKNKELFCEMKPLNENLHLADENSTNVEGKGRVRVKVVDENNEKFVNFDNALLVPNLRTNLVSVARIVDKDCEVVFNKHVATVRDIDGNVKLVANRVGNLYFIKQPEAQMAQNVCGSDLKLRLWHERLGHLNEKDLIRVLKDANISAGNGTKKLECRTCAFGKQTILPFKSSHERAKKKLEIIHSDICGPFRQQSMGGGRYYCTFIDDYSRYCKVYILRNKSDVFQKFLEYKEMVENLCERKIKFLQTDNGKEYCNNQFDQFLRDCGIQRRLTAPHTPQQNGVAERKNRTLLDMARCMMIRSGVSPVFWAEAVMAANYIRNRCPTNSLEGKIPYELWSDRKVNINHLRVFGTKAFVVNKTVSRGKLEERSIEGSLVGYSEQTKGYRVYIPKTRKVIVSRDVRFINEADELVIASPNENFSEEERNMDCEQIDILFPINEEINESQEMDEHSVNENQNMDEDEERNDNLERRLPGRPKLIRTGKPGRPKKFYRTTANIEVEENTTADVIDACDDDNEVFEDAIANYAEINLHEAIKGKDKDIWYQAIADEFKSLIKNDTWDVVERPQNKNIIDCRIVLANKVNSSGEIYKRKARLVARGFNQRKGYDYDQTFAPVARLESFRMLMALAVQHDLIIHQMDVASAFLHGKLDEEIYMEVPEFLENFLNYIIQKEKGNIKNKAINMLKDMRNKRQNCCKLKKGLYGLKQASRQWNKLLDSRLKNLGLKQSNSDPCIYFINDKDTLILILVYVDDILIAGNNVERIAEIKKRLKEEFEIKDMGEAKYCLGIEIVRKENEITLIQRKYIKDILNRFEMENAKGIDTPANVNERFDSEINNCDVPYRELIGALMYLAVVSRPDIMNRVVFLAQFTSAYSKAHWIAAKRVLRYVKQTSNLGLVYTKGNFEINGYADADWGSDVTDRKSYTGYVFMMCNGAISWKSQKQKTVAMSSAEAEYMAISETAKEAIHIKNFLKELKLKIDIKMFNDNQSANLLTRDAVFHARSKHIDLRYHFVRDVIKNNEFSLEYLPTEKMIADVLTKPLCKPKHVFCCKGMGLKEVE